MLNRPTTLLAYRPSFDWRRRRVKYILIILLACLLKGTVKVEDHSWDNAASDYQVFILFPHREKEQILGANPT